MNFLQNKKGDFLGILVFIIFAVIIVFVSGIFIYIGNTTETQLMDSLGNMDLATEDVNETIQDTFGDVNAAYGSLYWISVFIIFGMILSIFIGSYLVTTKPVFFLPYIFIVIIAVIVGVGISNAYEQVIANPTLADTFSGFVGANYILLHLPVWLSIIGITGGIIMFARMGKGSEVSYYG